MYHQAASNMPINMISYQQWRMAWYAFLDLLSIDYSSGFLCSKCGQYPSVVSCDATTLGFKKMYARSLSILPKEDGNLLAGR